MLAVNNLNYKYIYTRTANCVTASHASGWWQTRGLTCFADSTEETWGQENKFLWCMWFEVLRAVNVKTGLMGYKVGFGRHMRTCMRNLLPPTSGLMTIYQAPRRHIKKGKVSCAQKKWLRKEYSSGIFWSSAQVWPWYLTILWPS
jgi:hypothetical protein